MTLPSSVTQGGYTTTFPAATGTLAIGGGCSAGQYMFGNNLTTACSQVAYSQLTGTPTLGNWAALNYPTWTTGTPFVKMTGLGTFSLDTNIYLTSSAIASTTNLLSGNGSGNAVSSGIAASNVPLLNAANTFTATNTFNNATYSALFTGGPVGIGTTNPGYPLQIKSGNAGFSFDAVNQNWGTTFGTGGNFGIYAEAPGSTTGGFEQMGGSTRNDAQRNAIIFGVNNTETMRIDGNFIGHILGNVGIGTTAPAALLSVGSSSQFQVNSAGVSSAGAGSTDLNGSGVPKAHCLADGTNCPNYNMWSGNLTLGTGTSDYITFSTPLSVLSCTFSPSNSAATLSTILPWISWSSTGTNATVTINHAATVGSGATESILCQLGPLP
jgi:hypothetical protein